MSAQNSKPPNWLVLFRDIGSFLGGWALIFMEVQRTDVRESVLLLAAGMVGVPAAAVGAQAVTDAVTSRRTGTAESSSPAPEAASSSSQSSSP